MVLSIFTVHQAYGAYPLENDLSETAKVQSRKAWLVFMETRIRRCMTHRRHHDLLCYQRCLAFEEQRKEKCYERQFSPVTLTINKNTFMYVIHFYKDRKTCPSQGPIWPKTLQILVHKMFHMNLTLIHFDVVNRGDIGRIPENCKFVALKFIATFNNLDHEYCGKRYPWTVFVDSYGVQAVFPVSYNDMVNILAEIDVIDQDFTSGRRGTRLGGLVTWGIFGVKSFQITVDMLNRISIYLNASLHQHSQPLVYNGPHPHMPKLLPYKRFPQQTCYISSTFQVMVLILNPGNSHVKVIYNPYRDKEPQILTTNQTLYIRNNTGCGNKNDQSWMCILNIVVPPKTYAQLKITDFTITGPYSDTLDYFGVAVYNVINNKTNLVAYLSSSVKEYLTVTGTENQLFVSVYGYSPFAFVSGAFTAELSHCVGQFLAQQPSRNCRDMLLGQYKGIRAIRSYCIESKYMSFDVAYRCLALQDVIPPNEYFDVKIFRSFVHLDYDSQLKVDYHSITGRSRCNAVRLFGKYRYIHGGRTQPSYSVMGDVHHLYFGTQYYPCGHTGLVVVTVSKTPCMQPCDAVNIAMICTRGQVPICDLCNYFWLDFADNRDWYQSIPNRTVTIESMQGNLPARVRVSSHTDIAAGGHLVSHILSRFTQHFLSERLIHIKPQNGSVWRVPKDGLSQMYHVEGGSIGATAARKLETGKIQRRGMYEYTIASNMPSSISYDVWCDLNDASLLTIYDNHELRFVIERIMQPLKIEHIFIEIQRPVSYVPG